MILFQNKNNKTKLIFKAGMTGFACVLAGVSLLYFPKTKTNTCVYAEDNVSLATTDLFTSATTNKSFLSTLNDVTGVAAWKGATLNGVFKDTAKIEYTMDQWRNVVFGIYDTNGEEIITFTRAYKNQWNTLTYAYYNGVFSTPTALSSGEIIPTTKAETEIRTENSLSIDDKISLDYIPFQGATHVYPQPNYNVAVSHVQFTLEDDTFKIIAPAYSEDYGLDETATIAEFALKNADAEKLANGFTIQFQALNDTTSDVTIHNAYSGLSCIITKINEVALGGETVAATLSQNGSIFYAGEYVAQGKNVIELMEGEELQAFEYAKNYALGSFTIKDFNSEIFSYTGAPFAEKTAGEYSITVTKGETSKIYSVIVHEAEEVDTKSLFTSTSNILLETEIKGYKGVQIKSESMLSGIFKDSIEVEYVMSNDGALNCVFVLCDIDGNEIATFARVWENNWRSVPYAYYNGKFSTPNTDLSKVETTPVISETAFVEHKLKGQKDIPFGSTTYVFPEPGSGDAAENIGYVKFSVENGNLKISVSGKYYLGGGFVNGVLAVADFSLTNEDTEKLSKGFKVKIRALDSAKESDVVATNNGVTCLITKVDGVKFDEKNALLPPATFDVKKVSTNGFLVDNTLYVAKNANAPLLFVEGYYYGLGITEHTYEKLPLPYVGDYNVSQTGAYSITAYSEESKQSYAYTMIVEDSYKITFDEAGGEEIADTYYSQNTWDFPLPVPERANWKFGGWFKGEEKVEALTADMHTDITLQAKWYDDVPPIVYFDNIEALVHIDNPNLFSVSKTDVKILDGSDLNLGVGNITIWIKEPNTNEFIKQESFTFNPLVYGFYEIKYEVVDAFNNKTVLERKIYYTPTTPTLTLDGTIKEEYFVGEKVTLPTAVGLSGETALSVTISVLYNDQSIALVDNAFTPLFAGEYQVLYSTEDSSGQIASKTLTVVIINDTIAPEITVEFNVEKIEIGSTLELPIATAMDNVDGEVDVTVEVYLGTELVAGQSFVPQKVGVYTIYYICEDAAGNQSTLIKYFTVHEKIQQGNVNGETNGGSGCSATMGIPVSMLFVSGVLILLKKRKDND